MQTPCVRVPREDGERTRQELADAGLIDQRYRIHADDGSIFIPVTDREAVPANLEVVDREVDRRTNNTLPRDFLDEPPTYERLGDIALIDEDDPTRAIEVADALMASTLPIRAVLNRASKIKGTERVRDWEILAGDRTETIHREFGAEFAVDVTEVYFSPRLATERNRVVSQVEDGERVFDMFAGVGPFLIPAAMRGARGVGVDINPTAIAYLEENAHRNGVADHITAINDDVRSVAPEYAGWADRIIMNLPHSASEFLPEVATIADDECRLHYYDIQGDEAPFEAGHDALQAALSDTFELSIIEERVVRSYAPHEVNVCLDVRLQRA